MVAADLECWFATQTEYAFYGSSLLLAFDAALADEAVLRVLMIDFAHVHDISGSYRQVPMQGGRERGEAVLLGLRAPYVSLGILTPDRSAGLKLPARAACPAAMYLRLASYRQVSKHAGLFCV